MHITSTITSHPDAPPTDDVPVSALLLGERGVLVGRPETYEDLEAVVRAKFGLDATQAVVLETDTLNICRGRRFEIDRSAWPALRALLDVVLVNAGDARRAGVDAGQLFAPGALLTPSSSNSTLGARRYSAPSQDAPPEMGLGTDEEAEGPPPHHDEPQPGPPSRQDASDDDLYIRDSPAPGSAPPAGSASDSEDEFVPAARQADSESESDDPPEVEFIMKAESESESEPEEPQPSKAKAPVTQGAQRRPSLPQRKKEDKPVVVKKEKQPAASAPPDDALADDPRFLVEVKHAASARQAMFKTRAGHKVEKVLAGVCKSFGLDYERATLVLLVEIEEDGAHRFPCEKRETMGRCGIEAGARLVVEMDDDV